VAEAVESSKAKASGHPWERHVKLKTPFAAQPEAAPHLSNEFVRPYVTTKVRRRQESSGRKFIKPSIFAVSPASFTQPTIGHKRGLNPYLFQEFVSGG